MLVVIFGSFFFFFFFFFKDANGECPCTESEQSNAMHLAPIRPSVVIQHTTHKLLAHCHDMGWLQDLTRYDATGVELMREGLVVLGLVICHLKVSCVKANSALPSCDSTDGGGLDGERKSCIV